MIKVLDACSFANRFWVFAGGLTDVETVLTVTDTRTGGGTDTYGANNAVNEYTNITMSGSSQATLG